MAEANWPRKLSIGTAVLVTIGLGLRSFHYLRDPSVWHDEAMLMVNIMSKSFGELFGPLDFNQAAPPLFLWIARAVSLVLGDGSYALRLVPYLASCISLLLMVPIALRTLPARCVPLALLLFACCHQLLWHACEVKPYATDVLAVTILLAAFCATRHWSLSRQISLHAMLAPVLIFLSYPACFVYGGLLVALLPAVWRDKQFRTMLAYGILGAVVFGTFAVLVLRPVRSQRNEALMHYWMCCFPCWEKPWTVPGWIALSTLEVFRYCCKPIGQPLAALAVIGGIELWRRNQRALVLVLAVPLALGFLAACMYRYPYGGVRFMVYMTPALVLLISAGISPTLGWLRSRSLIGAALLLGLITIPVGYSLRTVIAPWPVAVNASASSFVHAHRRSADAVLGNDWTHRYYFRDLGSKFRTPDESFGEPLDRLWVVVSLTESPESRLKKVWDLAPGDWRILEKCDFRYVTAVLLERQRSLVNRHSSLVTNDR